MRDLRIGDCLEVLKTLEADSIDACVTDPPYELGFMGKSWDSTGIAYNPDLWREVLRVLKPGAHLLAFGGTRTYHRMACAIEDAGFEIRDQIQWLYGSGFPKSRDIGKDMDKIGGAKREVIGTIRAPGMAKTNVEQGAQERSVYEFQKLGAPVTDAAKTWDGWGTALKPANEPICVARKPLSEPTVAANVLKWGTGALNIGASRIKTADNLNGGAFSGGQRKDGDWKENSGFKNDKLSEYKQPEGRWPANIILDEEAGKMLDEQSGIRPPGVHPKKRGNAVNTSFASGQEREGGELRLTDTGGASRFFYCAKASKKDRGDGNNHPTVKPTSLMAYLCRLVTPPNGTVLDPFMGSGSTGRGAKAGGFGFVGIEREAEYLEIAKARIGELLP